MFCSSKINLIKKNSLKYHLNVTIPLILLAFYSCVELQSKSIWSCGTATRPTQATQVLMPNPVQTRPNLNHIINIQPNSVWDVDTSKRKWWIHRKILDWNWSWGPSTENRSGPTWVTGECENSEAAKKKNVKRQKKNPYKLFPARRVLFKHACGRFFNLLRNRRSCDLC